MPARPPSDAGRPVIIGFDHVTIAVRTKTILTDICFELRVGDKVVLHGPSGSGKSTLLKALLGLYPPSVGRILFDGRPLDRAVVREIRESAAYIGQEPVLGAETVREALLLPFRFKAHRGHEPGETSLRESLARLRLPVEILDRACQQVSGGEKQRIALARALLLRKSLYLLDEVTSALDAGSKAAVFEVFRDPGLTVLSVAHDPDWIAFCDVACRMDAGRLIRNSRRDDA